MTKDSSLIKFANDMNGGSLHYLWIIDDKKQVLIKKLPKAGLCKLIV